MKKRKAARVSKNIEDVRPRIGTTPARNSTKTTLKSRLINQSRNERMKAEQKALKTEVNKGLKW